MNTQRVTVFMLAMLTALSFASVARADRESELNESLKKRNPDIVKAKDDGKIGETYKGYVEAVKSEYASDEKIKKLIDEENKDRKEVYKIIAEKQKQTVEEVAKNSAARKFHNAKKGHWLKGEDGKWKQKE